MNTYLTISITATVVFFLTMTYHSKVIVPVNQEQRQKPGSMDQWVDFITANIGSSFTAEHCAQCGSMIGLFIVKFNKELPIPSVQKEAVKMWNILETRASIIKARDEWSGVTYDDLIK